MKHPAGKSVRNGGKIDEAPIGRLLRLSATGQTTDPMVSSSADHRIKVGCPDLKRIPKSATRFLE